MIGDYHELTIHRDRMLQTPENSQPYFQTRYGPVPGGPKPVPSRVATGGGALQSQCGVGCSLRAPVTSNPTVVQPEATGERSVLVRFFKSLGRVLSEI